MVGDIFTETLSPFFVISFAVFFILGFFIFAFFCAALGSTVSRIEEVNAIAQIPTMISLVGFMTAIIGGINAVDSLFVKVMSYIPLFTPMVMFTRQCMNAAANWEVVLSMFITAAGMMLTGFAAAKIYRTGVMMYGKPARPKEIWAMIVR